MIPPIAQAETPWLAPLAQLGVSGVVLIWFMLRSDSRMNDLKESMNNLAMAHLMSVVANQEASAAIREQAAKLIRDIEERRGRKR
jgi:hypothetical protein